MGVEVLDQAGAQAPQWQRPALWLAVGVARVGEQVADRDPALEHPLQHGDERRRRIDLAGADLDAAHQLGDRRTTLLLDGRDHLQVVAVEGLVTLTGRVAAPVPPGGLGIGAASVALRRWTGERLQVGPVDGIRARLGFPAELDARLQQGVEDLRERLAGLPVGLGLGERPRHEREGALHLAVGEQVGTVLPLGDHPEPPLLGLGQPEQRLVHPAQVGGAALDGDREHADQQRAHPKPARAHADRQHRLDPLRDARALDDRLEAPKLRLSLHGLLRAAPPPPPPPPPEAPPPGRRAAGSSGYPPRP